MSVEMADNMPGFKRLLDSGQGTMDELCPRAFPPWGTVYSGAEGPCGVADTRGLLAGREPEKAVGGSSWAWGCFITLNLAYIYNRLTCTYNKPTSFIYREITPLRR